ncbi:uncharacterized protein B0P05DRAFT_545925 [Gilbertella persicaria]|uniref:uncharacterized protein n=1 Tax=Gilbertella persicaria TaxID=101096 RepID=UPI00221EB452|nr:uncharacterized protein B0P05DRAFT_545925 [Gilbertella persicaria]KAI8076455.1 hypothetical protein B0P05DRAFT_545925 [Gilbertella persicaria]
MSSTKQSSDLLNVSGKDKKIENLIRPETKEKKSINDIPSLLAASSANKTVPSAPSDILSRVQAFLPQLKQANEQLKAADPSKLDIENVNEEGQYIEMNLGLGVFEEKHDSDDESDSEDIIVPKIKEI